MIPFTYLPPGQDYLFIEAIKNGAVFYFSDNDYLKHPNIEVKRETPCAETIPSRITKDSPLSIEPSSSSSTMSSSAPPTRKRPHRSAAATVKSYAYAQLDSDDETLAHENAYELFRHAHIVESDLQLWIKHLSALHKDETKKVRSRIRRPSPLALGANTFEKNSPIYSLTRRNAV